MFVIASFSTFSERSISCFLSEKHYSADAVCHVLQYVVRIYDV